MEEISNNSNSQKGSKYFLRERKLIKSPKNYENKININKLSQKTKKKKVKNNNEKYKRTTFHLSKIDLNSKKIHKNQLSKLILPLLKYIEHKKNKNNDEENNFFKKKELIKKLKEKIINLSIEQIKEISQKFFPHNNNNKQILLEFNKLSKKNFESLDSYVIDLEEKNKLNNNFIPYKEQIKIHKKPKQKEIDLNNYTSIFSKENITNDSDDSSSDESESLSNN